MTRILSLLMALALLCAMTPALAEGAPANPAPSASPETVIVPSMPDDGGYDSGEGMLSEEMIAQLDEAARDYLIGTGEMIDTIDGSRHILLVGLDARPGETRSRSDTMVILTLNGVKNEIRLTSLLRGSAPMERVKPSPSALFRVSPTEMFAKATYSSASLRVIL